VDSSGNDLVWHALYVFWVFTIEREAHHLAQDLDDSDDDFQEVAKRSMSKVTMNTAPS
jgi:hypothetical protein